MAGEIIAGTSWAEEPEEQEYIKIGETPEELLGKGDEESPVFTVPSDGNGVLLSAYGVCSDLKLVKVYIPATGMPSKDTSCCFVSVKSIVQQPTIEEADTVNQDCGAWMLNSGANTGVLTVPGTYALLSDEGSQAIVTAQIIAAAAVQNTPDNLKFGHTCC